MLPFSISLTAGESPFRQVVYAATRAVLSGELSPGASFPSVRELSQALKINPNTAQKVIAELVRAGLIEVRTGVGTIVTTGRRATAAERRRLLTHNVEQLVVEARRLGLGRSEVMNAVEARWTDLFGDAADGR